jgi:acyl-CoA thioester hydrolase
MDEAIDPSIAASVVQVRVRFGETDLMGVVHHANYASYMEVARIEWLRRRGVSYSTWADSGLHLPVVELTIKYRTPARFDDQITVHATLGEVGAASVRFEYRIVRAADGALCAEGSTRLACVDGHGILRRLSQEMLEVLRQPETTPIA